jgi:hypothetical protein
VEQHHEKNLKAILRKTERDFDKWVEHLTDEELTYVEWLLGQCEKTLDDILIEQSGLTDANEALAKIMAK